MELVKNMFKENIMHLRKINYVYFVLNRNIKKCLFFASFVEN